MTAVAGTIEEVRAAVRKARAAGHRVGLVPTMGALHAGHVSLIRAARNETGFVVVSIFVNPAQFGPGEDYETYPRPLKEDLEVCRAEGVDLVFAPDASEMYPSGFATTVRNCLPSSSRMPRTSARRTPSNWRSCGGWYGT